MTVPSVEDRLVEAIGHHRLAGVLADRPALVDDLGPSPTPADVALLEAVEAAARAIATTLRAEADEIADATADVRSRVNRPRVGDIAQQHTLTVRVVDADEAETVATILEPLGYERRDRWTGGAARSFRRHADLLTMIRADRDADGHTTSLRLRWADDRPRSRIQRLFRPTAGDWSMLSLPSALWWAYPAARAARLAGERIGVRRRHSAGLGPYLTTPTSLIDPLLDHIGVGRGDHLVDLGAGDGRVVAAAARRGARAVGIESDPELARLAQGRIAGSGDAEIVQADVLDVIARPGGALSRADVVLMFLPVDVAVTLVPRLSGTLRPGSRIVLHEQHRLPGDVEPPDQSRLVIGTDALTVAHTWTA